MNRTTVSLAVLCAATMRLAAMETTSLDGLWDFRFEKGATLEDLAALPAFEANDKMTVPGCWDTLSKFYNERGTGCYRRSFALSADTPNAFLVVDGMGLRARFWVDGREIGFCNMPWSRFELKTGPLSKGDHEIVAAVDSVVSDTKTKLFYNYYDFYPYGGFYHGVRLEAQQKAVELRRVVVRTRDYEKGLVELEAEFAGDGAPDDFEALVSFDGAAARPVAFKARRAAMNVPKFKLWSPAAPNLHVVSVAYDGLAAKTRFGIRTIGTADGRVTLNGRPIYLKGVNRHESHGEFGAATPLQLMCDDLQNLKGLGGNFIRGSHYSQCDEFLSLCDEFGVLVWEESLGWQNTDRQFKDPEFCDLQAEQTRLMARNSINHPCVVISGFLNEAYSQNESCKRLVDRLIETIRAEDTGHLVTFACNNCFDDISHANTDIIAYNTYPCWYHDEPKEGTSDEIGANVRKCHKRLVKKFRERYGDRRPIIVSETGIKAEYGAHDPRGKSQYSEDFQAEYTRIMLKEIFDMDEIAGIAIWQFTDSKTYTRTVGMRNRTFGVNNGGLYDVYRRPKLAAAAVREMFTNKAEP